MNQNRYIGLIAVTAACLSMVAYLFWPDQKVANGQGTGYSLRFYGHGVDDIDRVKIPVHDPARASTLLPTNIGARDFTIEFWIRGTAAENRVGAITCGANEDWIYGGIVLDRDRFSLGRKFGLSVDAGGRVVFGVTNEQRNALTICSNVGVLDGNWHHVVVQRSVQDGRLWLYIDGSLSAQANGPTGDISYPLNSDVSFQGPQYCQGPNDTWGGYCRNEPYFVLGAEKHDAGADAGAQAIYPSFNGWIDELRLSDRLRYNGTFTVPTQPFIADPNTVGLYHFDEGPDGPCAGTVIDSAQAALSPINGACSHGGRAPAGPVYSPLTPFMQAIPPVPATSTALPSPTASPVIVPTATPTLIATATAAPTLIATATALATAAPTATATPVAAATATATATPPPASANSALRFDGVDDQVFINPGSISNSFTVEVWVQPAVNDMEAVVLIKGDEQSGWSIELNGGRPAFWQATGQGWRVARYPTPLQAGVWYHIAATYNQGQVQVFVNGIPGGSANLGNLNETRDSLTLGGIPGYRFFAGHLDDLRLSNGIRYVEAFVAPTTLDKPNPTVLCQWSFNDGSGTRLSDDSIYAKHGRLGVEGQAEQSRPQWVVVQR